MPDEITHACPPDGSGLTTCCGRTPFELPRTDRIASESEAVTCAAAEPAAILRSLLPATPPPDWMLTTVFGSPHGVMLLPGNMGPVVVRRRVTYGDWEPVRPDHWADEPPPCACPNPPQHAATCPATADLWRRVAPGVPEPAAPTMLGNPKPGTLGAGVADCLFCRQDDPAANRIIASNATCFARWDNYPATDGHAEIVPKRHVESLFDLTAEELADVHALLAAARQAIAVAHGQPDGYTIGINEGRAAGRTIDHLHIHLIPRRRGDAPDPRGGIRNIIPGDDPDQWAAPNMPPAINDRPDCAIGCDPGDPCGDCLADMGAPELTAEEARALADDLGYDLYRAQDTLDFVAECCDNADREARPITTANVREWLKGARCGRQLLAESYADRVNAPLRPATVAALQARLAAGEAPRRKICQVESASSHPEAPDASPLGAPESASPTPKAPQSSDLRDRLAADLYERANPGESWADAHPDDLLAYGDDADRALATPAFHELQQGRAALAEARATNQRLNLRAQRLQSELAAYRRAVAQWEVDERGTYIPMRSLAAIGKAAGVDLVSVRVERAERDLAEARLWARHGYEIGQRHCGWSDHGTAPAWLTHGWPPHFGTCEHLKRAGDLDTQLARVRQVIATHRAYLQRTDPIMLAKLDAAAQSEGES